MGYSEDHWTAGDGMRMFVRQWMCDRQPKGVVIIIHGLGDHSGRFQSLAAALAREDFAVVAFDLRGHGKSPGKRGHTPSYEMWMADIDEALRMEWNPALRQLPVFLYGHSMGGNLVLNYALRRRPRITGIVATAPWLELAFQVPRRLVGLGKIMDRIWPEFSLSNRLDLEALSRDGEVVEHYKKDPLVHDRVSVRSYFSLRQAGLWALEHAAELSIPLLIMHGSGDRITSCRASEAFAERAKEFSTLMVWKGFYHEIHREPYNEEMLAYLLGWLKMTAELPSGRLVVK